jgi:hypothetical protein
MKSTKRPVLILAAGYVVLAGIATLSSAKGLWVKKCKDIGLPAENCLYCHTEKMPKKDTFKPETLNDRGKWLLAEKDKRKAKESDPEWLKDYPGGKEQK